MTLIALRAYDIEQRTPDLWGVIDHATGTPIYWAPTRSEAENAVPDMAFRCGARQEPAGCQVWTTHQTTCGAYRCRNHAAQHEAICTWRKK